MRSPVEYGNGGPAGALVGRLRRIFMLSLLFGFVQGCGGEPAGPDTSQPIVNFYNWFDYIHPATLSEFTRETGIKVNYDIYESDDVLEGKLLVGNSGYDLVVPTSGRLARQLSAGMYRPLDWDKLPNARELDPYFLEQLAEVDPGNRYGVPHSWGTTGISFNADRVLERMPEAPLDSWSLLFDPDVVKNFDDCGVTLLDSPMDVIPSALIYLGRDPRSQSLEDLEDAIAVIAAIRPYIRYFHQSQFVDDLANGEICLALGWSGAVAKAMHESAGLNLRYIVPKEGGLLWFEVMVIPADAPHIENSYRLIDHLLRPRVAADFTNATYYPSAVTAAVDGVDAALRADTAIYPPASVRERLTTLPSETPEYARQRLRLWTSMKAGEMKAG